VLNEVWPGKSGCRVWVVLAWPRLKGTVARDFLPLVFSTNLPHIVTEFTP
jgi:hypothetical protein